MSNDLINFCFAMMGLFVGIAGTFAFIEWRRHIKLEKEKDKQ